jgi:hypothetical protein
VGLGDGPHDRKSEAGAARGAHTSGLDPMEAVEDPVALVARDARLIAMETTWKQTPAGNGLESQSPAAGPNAEDPADRSIP